MIRRVLPISLGLALSPAWASPPAKAPTKARTSSHPQKKVSKRPLAPAHERSTTLPRVPITSSRSGGVSVVGKVQALVRCQATLCSPAPVAIVSDRNEPAGWRSASTDPMPAPVNQTATSMSWIMVISTGSTSG